MNTLLQFSAPPLLGAFIGYMTNYVAIKMLFRPLRPWKILGVRVPMTPGVIPSKRHQLAENIGEMVGEHLLTSADVSRAISGKGFQQELQELIDSRVETMLAKDLGPVTTVIPERFHSYFHASIRILRLRLITYMHTYLDSEDFGSTISNAVSEQLDTFLTADFAETFPQENQDYFFSFMEKTLVDLLASPAVKQWIADQVQQKIDTTISENRSLHDIIPPELSVLILDRLEQEAPALIEKFARLLEEPAMQGKITDAICSAINNFTSSLGPIASMMASFVSTDTIRDKVSSYLDDKGEEIGKWLSDDTVKGEVVRLLREKAEEFLKTPLSSLLKDVDPEKISTLNRDVSDRIGELLSRPQVARSLTDIFRDALSSQTQRPIEEIVHDLFGPKAVQQGKQWVAQEVTAIFRSGKVKQLLHNVVVEQVEKRLLAKPIGPLADLLPKKVQRSFADYILQQISDLLVREVPGLVDSLNIRKIVARKVNSLDLLRLEGLLMSIMQEQFKYINLFGALLGFLIGLFNLALLQL